MKAFVWMCEVDIAREFFFIFFSYFFLFHGRLFYLFKQVKKCEEINYLEALIAGNRQRLYDFMGHRFLFRQRFIQI